MSRKWECDFKNKGWLQKMSHSHLILGCESLIRQNIQLPVDLNLMCSLGKEPSFNMCISLLLTVDSLSLEISHLFFSKENDWGFSHFVPWNVSHFTTLIKLMYAIWLFVFSHPCTCRCPSYITSVWLSWVDCKSSTVAERNETGGGVGVITKLIFGWRGEGSEGGISTMNPEMTQYLVCYMCTQNLWRVLCSVICWCIPLSGFL